MAVTIRDAWMEASRRIAATGSETPEGEAREILRHALGLEPRELLLLDFSLALSAEGSARLERLLQRREAHEPLQYLLGAVPFCELEIEVGPGVLIPRPETEVLVERLSHWLAQRSREGSRPEWMVDVGTGSGAILLALLARFPAWRGVGIDRSLEALAYARRNLNRVAATSAGVGDRAAFVWADLLGSIRAGGQAPVGLVVSNPPYVRSDEIAGLAPEVRDHEPRIALEGGEDGLTFVWEIARRAYDVLVPGGLLAFELACDQPEVVTSELVRWGFEAIETYRDLAGRPRGVIVRRP